MNKIILIGNLTKDPELETTQSGISRCRFSLAVSRAHTNEDGERETDFFNCMAWRGTAENLCKYQKKGSKISLVGSVQVRNYEDNQGNKKTAFDVIASEIEYLSKASDKEAEKGTQKGKKPALQAFEDDSEIPF